MRDEYDNYEPPDDWEGDSDESAPVDAQSAPESTISPDLPPQVNGHLSGSQANGGNGYVLTHPNDLRSNLKQWQMQLAGVAYRILRNDPEYADKALPAPHFLEPLISDLLNAVEALKGTAGSLPPADLSESDIHEECEREARLAIEDWLGVPIWSKPTPLTLVKGGKEPEDDEIACEDATRAIVSNAEYLSRPSIVERLYYTQHISLGVGGKHEGKTTCVRTEALAIATGRPVYDRQTSQMPVIYAASDDEYPTTRMELIRMGWTPEIPLTMVRVKIAEGKPIEPERILLKLASAARRLGSHFIILDMLFDFVSIADEIKYAQTRYATGFVQRLADAIGGHVRSTHHSPKWMPDAASAAKAALGSQGIAARFSPILLSKKWADDLYTVESTTTRDPRGAALPVLCVERDGNGWAATKGEFKAWMKWKLYRQRILDLFGNEPGKELTVTGVVEGLEISRAEAQNALYQMSLDTDGRRPDLGRQKFGKGNKYKYFLNNGGDLFGSSEKW